jgi:alpha-glucosidase (family GH31 glycosyl hydrolase)
MNHIPFLLRILALYFCFSTLHAQKPLIMIPEKPLQGDSITIFFHAERGNAVLSNINGDVYIHSGVITQKSPTNTSWQHVRGEWGKPNGEFRMTKEAENVYSFRMHPKSFYGIESDETILRLAFVFRNADGSKAGKDADGKDFYLDYPGSDSVKSIGEVIMESLSKGKAPDSASLFCRGFYQDSLGLLLYVGNGKVSIERFGNHVIRVSYDTIEFPAIRNPEAIIASKTKSEFLTVDAVDYFQFITTDKTFNILVQKQPFAISIFRDSMLVYKEEQGLMFKEHARGLSFSLRNSEAIFGGGSRALPVNRRGHRFPLYNTAVYGYGNQTDQLNVSIPFFLSSSRYGVLIDSPIAGAVDCGVSEKNVMKIAQTHGSLSYFLIIDSTFDGIMSHYAMLTGKQPLPPLWSLGYIQSRYGYKSQQEVMNIVSAFDSLNIPLDAIVLDLYWFGDKAKMGSFAWDTSQFPDPLGMMRSLKKRHIHTILITEPYFTKESKHYAAAENAGLFTKQISGSTYLLNDFWAGKASLLDLTNPKAMSWMSGLYSDHIKSGVSGWWLDLGEPEMHPMDMRHAGGSTFDVHNSYSMHWMSALQQAHQQYAPKERLFNLIRSGGPGMQRYSTFPWSGDVQRSSSGLQAQIPIMLGMGMSGVGYMHSDLGGFTGGAKNERLYTRWMQFGAFTPIMRAHGEGVPPEPIYYSDSVRNIVKYFIQLRMQFLPYNYTLAYHNAIKGTPLARPIFWNGPISNELISVNDEYLWGNDLVIAPIMHPDSLSRKVILPPGTWFDFWSNYSIPGYSNFSMPSALTVMPIFARGGSIIPLTFPMNNTATYKGDSLLLLCFRDSSINSVERDLYMDDGLSSTSLNDEHYRLFKLSMKEDKSRSTITFSMNTVAGKGYSGEPQSRIMILKWIDVPEPSALTLDGKNIPLAKDELTFYQSKMPIAWFKQSKDAQLPQEVHIRMIGAKVESGTLVMQYGKKSKK